MSQQPKTAIALRHLAFEGLGMLAPMLAARGWQVETVEPAVDDLDPAAIVAADLLIVLGGPIGAYDGADYPFVTGEIEAIAQRLAAGRPTLGICLGAQLMAAALGARVYPGPVKEIGWGRLWLTAEGRASVLAPLAAPEAHVLHWHGDTFDLPAGAVRLAENECYQNQAFAHGPAALALQFHLEPDPARLEHWLVGHVGELHGAGVSVPALRARSRELAAMARAQAEAIFGPWLDAVAATLDR
jgi:GMP synthase (glutamine-hydrolysing)